jgi:hypothetical protein
LIYINYENPNAKNTLLFTLFILLLSRTKKNVKNKTKKNKKSQTKIDVVVTNPNI